MGNIGEACVAEFLTRRGYQILDRNYLKKWGELDIVAKKGRVIHFVEVKSVSRKTASWNVTHGTEYRPEENVHPAKLKKLSRVIQTYILEKRLDDYDWQLDVAAAYIDEEAHKARVELLENIVI